MIIARLNYSDSSRYCMALPERHSYTARIINELMYNHIILMHEFDYFRINLDTRLWIISDATHCGVYDKELFSERSRADFGCDWEWPKTSYLGRLKAYFSTLWKG